MFFLQRLHLAFKVYLLMHFCLVVSYKYYVFHKMTLHFINSMHWAFFLLFFILIGITVEHITECVLRPACNDQMQKQGNLPSYM